jgi:RNA polymerase sigma-70 factor (ECF subfamily)
LGGPENEKMGVPLGRTARTAASDPTDDELIARARDGDHEAFRVLVERHQGRLFRLAARVLRDQDLARDAVQDAFLKAYVSLRRFEGRSSFYTWLYRLTLNVCLDMRRRSKSDRTVEWNDAQLPDGSLPGESISAGADAAPAGPDVELERAEIRDRVSQAIDELPQEARETLLLREVDGLSYAEIAETLGIPRGTVMSRLHYARKRVQKLLVAAGIVAEGAEPVSVPEGQEGDT